MGGTLHVADMNFQICFLLIWLSSYFRPYSTKEGQKKYDLQSKQKVRYEEYTPLGKALLEGPANLSSSYVTFKLMNYNILAQTHMMTHIRNYKNCPRMCLNWSFRKAILSHEFQVEKPDIFCLQEVEESHRTELLEPLRKMGYDALYVGRGEGKPDGCALLYSTSKFQVADFSPVHYLRPEMPLLDRPNVGIVARLELCNHPGNYVTIANTHFLYNQRRVDIKICQLQILLAETEKMAFAESPNKYHPVILTGDLNVNSDTCLISLLRNRYVNCRNYNTRRWRSVKTSEGEQLSVPDELLQHYLNISPDCQYSDLEEARRKGFKDSRRKQDLKEILDQHRVFTEISLETVQKENPTNSHKTDGNTINKNIHDQEFKQPSEGRKAGILRHGFPFIDVYQHPQLDRRQSWTSQPEPKQNVYDYMFYSGDLQLKHKNAPYRPVAGQLQLLSRLRMPSVPEHKLYFPSLPNYACGSDHLPLSATFLLPVH